MKYFNRATSLSLISLYVFVLSASGMEEIGRKDVISVGVALTIKDQQEKLKFQEKTEADLQRIKEEAEREKAKALKNFRAQEDLAEAQKIEEAQNKAAQDLYELEQKQIRKNIAPSLNELEGKIALALRAQKQEFQDIIAAQRQEYTNKCNALNILANNQKQQLEYQKERIEDQKKRIENLTSALGESNKRIKKLESIRENIKDATSMPATVLHLFISSLGCFCIYKIEEKSDVFRNMLWGTMPWISRFFSLLFPIILIRNYW